MLQHVRTFLRKCGVCSLPAITLSAARDGASSSCACCRVQSSSRVLAAAGWPLKSTSVTAIFLPFPKSPRKPPAQTTQQQVGNEPPKTKTKLKKILDYSCKLETSTTNTETVMKQRNFMALISLQALAQQRMAQLLQGECSLHRSAFR